MKKLCMLLLLALTACAETDPYKRLDPARTGEMTNALAAEAFDERWPQRFKTVQTVTIDFKLQTRTLVGYLVVQRSGQFRLQGMTEQGLKLFDVAYNNGKTTRVFAAEEFDAKVLDNIVRDICRVFLASSGSTTGGFRTSLGDFGLMFAEYGARETDQGTRVTFEGTSAELDFMLVGKPPRVDGYAEGQSGRDLYRVDHYEWREFGDQFLPSIVVLREPGIQSDGPPYKLTIKITELTVRDKPWPEKMFAPETDD